MGNNNTITVVNTTNTTPTTPRKPYNWDPLTINSTKMLGPGTLLLISFIVNIVFVLCIRLRLRKANYLFLENIIVVDLLTSITSGPLWMIGILSPVPLDFIVCLGCIVRLSGFIHTSLVSVFLNTIIVVSASHLIFQIYPANYRKLFPNNTTKRILLLVVWMYSIAISAPPLNPGIWGEYYCYETICTLNWNSGRSLSFSLFHTFLTLVPAVVFTAATVLVIIMRKNRIQPNPVPRGEQNPSAPALRSEDLYICMVCLVLHIAIWLPLVLSLRSNIDQNNIDWRPSFNLTLPYFMYAQSILHPIIYLGLSIKIRAAFWSLFCCQKLEEGTVQETTA